MIDSFTDGLVSRIHALSFGIHESVTGKKKIGVPIYDEMKRIGQVLPSRTEFEQIDTPFALAMAGSPVQEELNLQMKALNQRLIKSKTRPQFSGLKKPEAQRIVNLATSAYRAGISGFKMNDPIYDAYENGNIREPITPGGHIHELRLEDDHYETE